MRYSESRVAEFQISAASMTRQANEFVDQGCGAQDRIRKTLSVPGAQKEDNIDDLKSGNSLSLKRGDGSSSLSTDEVTQSSGDSMRCGRVFVTLATSARARAIDRSICCCCQTKFLIPRQHSRSAGLVVSREGRGGRN